MFPIRFPNIHDKILAEKIRIIGKAKIGFVAKISKAFFSEK